MSDPTITSLMSSILHPVILGSFLQGVETVLLFIAVYCFAKFKENNRSTSAKVLFGAIVALYFSSLFYLIANWGSIDMAFIKNGASTDTILGWLFTSPLYYSIFPETFRLFGILLADSIMTWRCWVVWGRSFLVIIPLAALILINFVFMVCNLVLLSGAPTTLMLTTKVAGTAIFSITFATTVLATLLIVGRIIYLGRANGASFGSKIIEMVVESSALYAISIIIVIPFWVMPATDPNSYPLTFTQEVNQGMLVIAPTLLYIRVLLGGARPDMSWTNPGAAAGESTTAHHLTSDARAGSTEKDLEASEENA